MKVGVASRCMSKSRSTRNVPLVAWPRPCGRQSITSANTSRPITRNPTAAHAMTSPGCAAARSPSCVAGQAAPASPSRHSYLSNYARKRLRGGGALIAGAYARFSGSWFARRTRFQVVVLLRHPAERAIYRSSSAENPAELTVDDAYRTRVNGQANIKNELRRLDPSEIEGIRVLTAPVARWRSGSALTKTGYRTTTRSLTSRRVIRRR